MISNKIKRAGVGIALSTIAVLIFACSSVFANQALFVVRILPPLALTDEGAIDYHTTALTPVSVFPTIAVEGMESIYEVNMPVAAAIPQGGTISFLLPSGFSFTHACDIVSSEPENEDINGTAPGRVSLASITCTPSKFRVTVTVGAAIRQNEYLHFYLQGIVNGTGVASASDGNVIGIETRGESGTIIELITSLPFFLTQAGTQIISGTVFNDNGAGLLGFSGDGTQSGSEPGVVGVDVCLNSSNGSRCQKTNTSGTYLFSQLRDGLYSVNVSSIEGSALVGGPFQADVELSGGGDKKGLDFGFTPADRTIIVEIIRIPDQTDVRVFAVGGEDGSGYGTRDVVWNGQTTRSVTLPVVDGLWSVGVEPVGTQSPPFIIPSSQDVRVSGDQRYEASFILYPATLRVTGRVVDTRDNAIPSAHISAIPYDSSDNEAKEFAAQSLSDGSFELTLASGLYRLEALVPGMPPISPIDIQVRDDSGNSARDNNPDADIYRDDVLVTNSGRGDVSDLTFVVPRGERSISGRVLDEQGGPIASAVVTAEEIDDDGNVVGSLVEKTTDATGQFTLFVTDGKFALRAHAPIPGEILDRTVTLSGKNITGQEMHISLARYGTIKGTVTKGGKVVLGAFVNVSGSAGDGSATTDTDGNYSVRVKAGSGYRIEATIKGVGRLAPIENVTVVAGGTIAQKNFIIDAPGTILVTVSGVTDGFIDVRDEQFNGDGTSSNATPGKYRVSVPAGVYTVTAQSPRYGVIGKKQGVVISSGSTTTVAFTPPSSLVVEGVLVSDAAECVAGATVSVVDTTNGRLIETTTTTGGLYGLTLSPGIYALTASKKGCIDGSEPLFFVVKSSALTIDSRRLVPASSSVSGAVQVAGKYVSFETKVVAESVTGAIQSTSADTTVQSGNNYTLNLAAGTWTIFARADGYESSKHTVAISGGRTVNLILATIPGHVRTERVTTSVSPSKGGVLKNADAGEKFSVVLPAGALGNSTKSGSVSTKVTTALVTKTPTAEVVGGKGIEITPKDSDGKPISSLSAAGSDVRIAVPYSKSEVTALGVDEKTLMLAVWSESKQRWTPFATTVDTANMVLFGAPPHFSLFAPIVPNAPPTPAALLPTESTSTTQQSPTTSTPSISGTILVRPTSPQATTSAPPVEGRQENVPALPPVKAIHEIVSPLIISAPPVVEESAGGSTPQPSSITHKEKPSTAPIDSPKRSVKRFPSSRVATPAQRQVVSSVKQRGDMAPTVPDFFELSIALDDGSRTLLNGGAIIIHGEIAKSFQKRESVLLRFLVADQRGTRIFDRKEQFVSGEHGSFTKRIELSQEIPQGYYTVTVEAEYRDDVISSSDRLLITKPIPQPAQIIQEAQKDMRAPSFTQSIFPAVILLILLTVYGIVHVWYTLWRVFHRQ